MTQERYETIKADFVNQYRPLLCEESMEDISAAHDFHAFVDVLRKYMAYNTYRPFPDADWLRKWFADDKKSLHDENLYLDDIVLSIVLPEEENPLPILCYGKCSGTAIYKKTGKHYIMLQDSSKIDILTYGTAVVFVKMKDDADIHILHRDKTSIVKLRRYDTTNGTKWQ